MEMKKILVAGESWTSFTTHVKGFDTFVTSVYEEGIEFLAKAIDKAGYELVYLPGQYVAERFPRTAEELSEYACVVLSDIGSNTLLLSDDTFKRGVKAPNRCQSIAEYVQGGGSFLMVGGYMSFSGIDGKARYGETAVQDVLPIVCIPGDDRAEHPEGITPQVVAPHSALASLPNQWPHFLGYNKVLPREGCDVPITIGGDPLVAFGQFGKGKTAVFTSDCAPHWGPQEFLAWEGYNVLWKGIFDYLTN
ncbi:glutamine amidotransferase [Selenomonas felix]|uniref:glutamine amidotransferase n=1 Tax=Selenomonas felix TaxID=1944634 RepID=UPI002357CED0|nr:glutamine amidotransferase [Selenomonas felix]